MQVLLLVLLLSVHLELHEGAYFSFDLHATRYLLLCFSPASRNTFSCSFHLVLSIIDSFYDVVKREATENVICLNSAFGEFLTFETLSKSQF